VADCKVKVMEHLGLGGEVVIGIMLGHIMREQRAIKKHLLGCPTCKRSRFPLASLLTAGAILVASMLTGCKVTMVRGSIHGQPFVLRDARCLLNTGAEFTMPTSNGPVSLKISSSPAAEAMGAVAEGVAKGLGNALKP